VVVAMEVEALHLVNEQRTSIAIGIDTDVPAR
jgi:hypothetical protein